MRSFKDYYVGFEGCFKSSGFRVVLLVFYIKDAVYRMRKGSTSGFNFELCITIPSRRLVLWEDALKRRGGLVFRFAQ